MRPMPLLEVCAGMGAVIGVSWWLRPDDPLLTMAAYPWMAVATTIFAARYGVLAGSLAIVILTPAWWLFYGRHGVAVPAVAFAGLAIQTLIVGHLCDGLRSDLREVLEERSSLRRRMAAITGDYYLIKAAREQSEKEQLQRTARSLQGRGGRDSAFTDSVPLPGAQRVLEQIALTGTITQAGLYACVDGRLNSDPCGCVGATFVLDSHYPLVAQSVEKQVLTWANESDFHRAIYLVCIPVLTSDQQLLGVVVIRRMAFLALNRDNLELLFVLLSAYADGIRARREDLGHV